MANSPFISAGEAQNWKPNKQELFIIITLAIISLMAALDATILVPILPAIAHELHGSAMDVFWTGTSYLLTSAISQPFVATLSDIFGRRELLAFSILLFTVGSINCAVAHSFTVLLTGRFIQGVGGGGIITLVQIIFTDIVPLRQRPKWFSIVLIAWALGSVIGPLIGGVFIQKATFRWVFWINLPFCGVGLTLTPFLARIETPEIPLREKLLRPDWIGGCLFLVSITSVLVGTSRAGSQVAWSSPNTVIPIVIGIAGIGATFVWQRHSNQESFLRRSLFYDNSAIFGYICAFLQGLILFCAVYYVPFYFASIQLRSPISCGVSLLPVSCFLLPGSALVSQLITRIGQYRWAIWSGWAITTTGAGLLFLLGESTKVGVWATALLVFGVGNGMLLSAINFSIQAAVSTEDAGRAASMYTFVRSLGMAIGVATGGTLFQNLMLQKLQDLGLPTSIALDAERFIAQLKAMAESDPVRIGATQAYMHGFTGIFTFITSISATGLLASCFIRNSSMYINRDP